MRCRSSGEKCFFSREVALRLLSAVAVRFMKENEQHKQQAASAKSSARQPARAAPGRTLAAEGLGERLYVKRA